MSSYSGVILVLALGGLIVLPVMVMRSLARSADAPAMPDGDGWVLRASPAAYYAAAFCMIAPLGVAARLEMGAMEPDFSIWNAGPLAGIIFAGFAAAIAIFLVVRTRLRTIRYDANGIAAWGRHHRWQDLTAAGPVKTAPATVARFADGSKVVVRIDMAGQLAFKAFLKDTARGAKVRWRRQEG